MSAAAFLYESFAAAPFGGNMAGVVLLEADASAKWMQGLASDLAVPTTGFVNRAHACTGDAKVRFFTPRQEIDACGHVTVALATALVEEHIWSLGGHGVVSAGGRLPLVLARDDERGETKVTMRQTLLEFDAQPEARVDDILGEARRDSALPIVRAGTGLRHLLVPVETSRDLALLTVDATAVLELSRAHDIDTVGFYAVSREDGDAHLDVRMRDLCAGIGATEEPASGTTAGALALALHQLGAARADALVEVTMGVEMGRPSQLRVGLDSAGSVPEALVSGSARRVLTGCLG